MKKYKEGSITVFLSLVLLLVLAIIITTVEAARVNAASAISLRAFMAGLDSVMAEYYGPLYEEYHVFGLDAAYGSTEINQERISEKLSSYMEYTFQPEKDLTEDIIYQVHNLYGIQVESIVSEQLTSLLDYKGELFEKQAVEYMKYKVPASVVSNQLNHLEVLEDTKECIEILEEKEKTEAQVQKLDNVILELMEKVDGITISNKGIKMKSGEVVIKKYFAKKFISGNISMSAAGINNEWIYSVVKSHYRDLNHELERVLSKVEDIENLCQSIESIGAKVSSLSEIDTSKMTQEEKEDHEEIKKEAIDQLNHNITEKSSLIREVNSIINDIKENLEGVLKATNEAIDIVTKGETMQEGITKEIERYEELVRTNEEKISEEFFESLQEGIELLSKYKGDGADNTKDQEKDISYGSYHLLDIKQILSENQTILTNASNALTISINTSDQSFSEFTNALLNAQNEMIGYNARNIKFDYSTVTKPVDSEPFLHEIKNLANSKLLELVIEEPNSISDKVMDKDDVPSNLLEGNPSKLTNITAIINDFDMGKNTNIFTYLRPEYMVQTAAESGEKILSMILFQEYLDDHFENFSGEMNRDYKVLDYEQEYILNGNQADDQNISAVVSQLLAIRTVLNLITLLSDKSKVMEAKLLATTFVGFTGMPLLVEAMKMIILTMWALVEGVVDITALLKNRAVPILKTGKEIQVNLVDIMGINKVFIHKKVLNYKESKSPGSLLYKDYIMLFLFFKDKETKLYQTMDLIQNNVQKNYDENFYIRNCMTGLNITSVFTMDPKLVSMPFVNDFLKNSTGRYQYTFSREYTY